MNPYRNYQVEFKKNGEILFEDSFESPQKPEEVRDAAIHICRTMFDKDAIVIVQWREPAWRVSRGI